MTMRLRSCSGALVTAVMILGSTLANAKSIPSKLDLDGSCDSDYGSSCERSSHVHMITIADNPTIISAQIKET